MADGSKTINNIMQHSNKHRCTIKPCGILLGILGGGVLLCFPNPDPISDQKLLFSTPDFRPGLKAEIMSSLLRLERKQKNSSKIFRIRIFLCRSYSFGTEMINMFIHSHRSLESHTQFQTKMGKVYTRFQTRYSVGPKPTPFRVAHTDMVDIKEYSPPPPPELKPILSSHPLGNGKLLLDNKKNEDFINVLNA